MSESDACRVAFEEWAHRFGFDLDAMPSGGYIATSTLTAWIAWQAAWNRRAPAPGMVTVPRDTLHRWKKQVAVAASSACRTQLAIELDAFANAATETTNAE